MHTRFNPKSILSKLRKLEAYNRNVKFRHLLEDFKVNISKSKSYIWHFQKSKYHMITRFLEEIYEYIDV